MVRCIDRVFNGIAHIAGRQQTAGGLVSAANVIAKVQTVLNYSIAFSFGLGFGIESGLVGNTLQCNGSSFEGYDPASSDPVLADRISRACAEISGHKSTSETFGGLFGFAVLSKFAFRYIEGGLRFQARRLT